MSQQNAPRAAHNEIQVFPLPAGIAVERDVGVSMPDGVRLSANVFRPEGSTGPLPVILALTPYGKDANPATNREATLARRAKMGLGMGRYRVSECTPFEAPDPAYWVPRGYAVVHVDLRGSNKSQGERKVYSRTEIADYSEIIEWAGTQPWSNGKVGLHGVSYLAIVQWFAAANHPPHLAAIVPWEGLSDHYRDVRYHGGVPETAFHRGWARAMTGAVFEEPKGPSRTPLISEVAINKADLPEIRVPALICGSFSDQGLHTKGSFDAFARIGSEHKWLYTHGRGKWTVYYDEDALDYQRQFLDCFLKGEDNGQLQRPRVRLEVRESADAYHVREEPDWPLPSTQYAELYLHADNTLSSDRAAQPATVRYDAKGGQQVHFDLRFNAPCEISGHMRLRLWVETTAGDDMDLFVAIQKLDAKGEQVYFEARENHAGGPVSLGWLRVSHRALDPDRSRPFQPVLSHDRRELITPGQVVPVDIEILPSSTFFEAGQSLRLLLSGADIFSHPMLHHRELCNQGDHILHLGGSHDSNLLVPFVPAT
ncbi:MAG: CocE/NonD family hydrolase [Myxococcales bacterium]|nr:CocE/NonD family hydrolase [Myxococcales bacterium]MDD9970689.1 CocE/NonD family hydrolase [Myxococcales bacterium]